MRGLILVVDYTTGISCPATSVITKYYRFFFIITKCDRYYKVRRLLQSATVQHSREDVKNLGHFSKIGFAVQVAS